MAGKCPRETDAMRKNLLGLYVLTMIMMAAGCAATGDAPLGSSRPAHAVLTLFTEGTGTAISAIDVTVGLPSNVTVTSAAASGIAAGSNPLIASNYTAGTATTAATVRIGLISATGFGVGEFCTIAGEIAAGHAPSASDFRILTFSAVDQAGAVIHGLTPGLKADLR
jgi:hypothetical protein